MATPSVFMIKVAYDENRVRYIDFDVRDNEQGITAASLKDLLRSSDDLSTYRPVTLIPSADLGGMDILSARDCGSLGLLSHRAVEILRPYMEQCFEFVPVVVNRRPSFLIRAVNPIDALDRKHCKLLMATDEPGKILMFERFAFFKDRLSDATIFTVPEAMHQYFFCTDEIPSIVERAKLRGFRFVEAEQEGAIYK